MADCTSDASGRIGQLNPRILSTRIGFAPSCHTCHVASIGWRPWNHLRRNGYDKTSSPIYLRTASSPTSTLPSLGSTLSVQKRTSTVLSLSSSLCSSSDMYVHPAYDDGRAQLLLCVHGVLPITFRNASYNIPVALWIPRDYPKLPPVAYVVPTNDMLIKPGRYVDVSGRCNPDYVRNWERKHEVSCFLIPGPTLLDRQSGLQPHCIVASHARPVFPRSSSFL